MSPKYLNEIRKETLLQKIHWKAIFQRPLGMYDLVNEVHVYKFGLQKVVVKHTV